MSKKIKIACIGNMNNMMFTLCRYLRDNGYDARLFLLEDEAEHFLPGADSYDNDYLNYTATLPVSRSSLFKTKAATIRPYFKEIDFFIGTDIAPALLACIGKKLDVFVPHGSDIYSYPFLTERAPDADRVWWTREIYFISKMQARGIRSCPHILFPDEYDTHFPYKHKLKTQARFYNFSVPMLYAPQYHDPRVAASFSSLQHFSFFNELRKKYQLIVFSHARQNGFNLDRSMNVHEKGNDILIKGYADFLRKNLSLSSCLVLFEYGMDVQASKTLVQELGIEKNVVWMPKMHRKEIMYGLMQADLGCGEFFNSWLTCGVVNETLVLGKPLMHYRDDTLYTQEYEWLYPLLNCRTQENITQALEEYTRDKEARKQEASKGTAWIEAFTVHQPLDKIKEILSKTSAPGSSQPGMTRSRLFYKTMVNLRSAWIRLSIKTRLRTR